MQIKKLIPSRFGLAVADTVTHQRTPLGECEVRYIKTTGAAYSLVPNRRHESKKFNAAPKRAL